MTLSANRPRILWFKAMLPGAVRDGSTLASLNLAKCLAQDFDLDLVSLRLRGNEDEIAKDLSPPFSSIRLLRPDNDGSIVRRALFRVMFEVQSRLTGVPRGALYDTGTTVRRCLREMMREKKYDLVHFEYWTAGPLLGMPFDCPKILFLHDATWVTVEQRAAYETRPRIAYQLRRSARELRNYELQVARCADRAHFLSPADMRHFEEGGIQSGAYVPIQFQPLQRRQLPLEGDTIAFTARLEHYPNIDALRWLITEIFPRIRANRPRTVLKVAGPGLSTKLKNQLATDGVELLGWVDDLEAFFEGVCVAVAPLRMGTGTKLKVLEQMWHGLPMVVTTAAAPGTPAQHGGAILADNADGFADAVVDLLQNRQKRLELREQAWDLLERDHCGEAARQRVVDAFHCAMQRPIPKTV